MNDLRIITDKNTLVDTCYIEVLPGKYKNQCWNDDSIYFEEDAFCYMEKAIVEVVNDYDHYAFTEITKSEWLLILDRFKEIVARLASETEPTSSREYLFYQTRESRNQFESTFQVSKIQLSEMITEFSQWITHELKDNAHISVLGI